MLWSYQTTVGKPIGSTPFTLVYGIEVVIHAEVVERTTRTSKHL